MAERGYEALIQVIRETIRTSPEGSISFRDYMAACLYHERYGYYMNDRVKVGREGDFYTSSNVGTLMGEMLARALLPHFRAQPPEAPLSIVEWGAGTGRLASQLLAELRRGEDGFYRRLTYTLVEASPYHRRLQLETLQPFAERVQRRTEDEWRAERVHPGTVVIANELLDAFPVYRIGRRNGLLHELRVGWDEAEGRLAECREPLRGELLRDAERQGAVPEEGQTTELNVEAGRWIAMIGERLPDGKLIVIDYGAEAEELTAPHRMQGTLMCYRRHRAHNNPYIHVGEQDMTAHVNFTACLDAGKKAGFRGASLQTQKEFLIAAGILDELREHDARDPFSAASKRNRAIRQLLISDQMSELFKVLVLDK